jgi:hypothetical protein
MHIEEHQAAAEDLDAVADEHHAPFRHGVGEGADKGRQGDVGDGEEGFQQRFVLCRRAHVAQDGDGSNQQGVVGQRGKKLRRHDDVKTLVHSVATRGRFGRGNWLWDRRFGRVLVCRFIS